MGNILVTGGAGYIGSHTAVELNQAGYVPIILDDFSNSDPVIIEGLKQILGYDPIVYQGDCNDWQQLKEILKNHKIGGIIHFAAYKSVSESVSKPIDYYYNNINSLINMIRMMGEGEINNLVFSSSCSVYGEPDILPVTENSPLKKAVSPYGNTKQVCEQILEDFYNSQPGIKSISLRYFNPIGAHHSSLIGELPLGVPNNLVPYVTQTAAGIRKTLTIFGDNYNTPDGTCIRDYIHVVDLAQAHVKSLNFLQKQESKNHYDVFNIGTGKGDSVLEIVQKFETSTNQKINYVFGDRRPGDVEKVFASVDKAKNVLKWKSQLTTEQALIDAWNWQLNLPTQSKLHAIE